ncbi:MAG: hypothetical protein KatS3mg060_3747 [Dehalococcoidia bacterium]|nr:MAG: hypothetical protein KatS3mg060_3747 [Dehalococcoidia bacterium]
MLDQLRALEEEARVLLAEARTVEDLERWKSRFLGRKSAVSDIIRGLGSLPPAERPVVGASSKSGEGCSRSGLR